MKIMQVHLAKEGSKSHSDHLTCWLPEDAKIKVGTVLTLKGIEGKWTVKEIYSTVMEHYEINRKWDVGGL